MKDVKTDAIKRWSKADVPQAQRLDYLTALSETVFPARGRQSAPGTFNAKVSFSHFGVVGVSKQSGLAHSSVRGRKELARSGDQRFCLFTALQSFWTIDHRGEWQMLPHNILLRVSEFPTRVDVRHSYV